jgi:hypothetical protein
VKIARFIWANSSASCQEIDPDGEGKPQAASTEVAGQETKIDSDAVRCWSGGDGWVIKQGAIAARWRNGIAL